MALFGYLRGANLKRGQRIHLAGVGDLDVSDITVLPDPCPLPDTVKKKGLNDKEKLLCAPHPALTSGVRSCLAALPVQGRRRRGVVEVVHVQVTRLTSTPRYIMAVQP